MPFNFLHQAVVFIVPLSPYRILTFTKEQHNKFVSLQPLVSSLIVYVDKSKFRSRSQSAGASSSKHYGEQIRWNSLGRDDPVPSEESEVKSEFRSAGEIPEEDRRHRVQKVGLCTTCRTGQDFLPAPALPFLVLQVGVSSGQIMMTE
ncbi:unnamed protein product [Amoebophrya sp. A120]|nr:unnamed protein product [Amoebophrya sp. A120]|eukprot:GSA120T00007275001.1